MTGSDMASVPIATAYCQLPAVNCLVPEIYRPKSYFFFLRPYRAVAAGRLTSTKIPPLWGLSPAYSQPFQYYSTRSLHDDMANQLFFWLLLSYIWCRLSFLSYIWRLKSCVHFLAYCRILSFACFAFIFAPSA